MFKFLNEYKRNKYILKRCSYYSKNHHSHVYLIALLYITSALTDGLTIALVIPILQSFGDEILFKNIPFFGVIDNYFGQYPINVKMQLVAIIVLVLVIFKSILNFIVPLISASLSLKLSRNLSNIALASFFNLSMEKFISMRAGDVMNILSNYGSRIALVINLYTQILANVVLASIYIIMMMFISYKITLVIIISSIILSLLIYIFTFPQFRKIGRKLTEISSKIGDINHEVLYCMKLIRLSVAEKFFKERYKDLLDQNYKQEMKNSAFSFIAPPSFQLLSGIAVASVLYFVFKETSDKSVEILGSIVLYFYISGRLVGPLINLNTQYTSTRAHHDAFDKLDNYYLSAAKNKVFSGKGIPIKKSENIVFKNVSFKYKNSKDKAVYNFSVTLPKNKMTALVGRSGAGKTTIINLITGLFQAKSGEIKVGKKSLKNMNIFKWRRQCRVIPQDVTILNASLRENICFGQDRLVSDKEIYDAIELSAATDFVKQLPNGLDSNLGQLGGKLSGGQQQRIAIARALLDKPSFIIFDEPTSSLDSISEREILNSIDKLRKDRTIIVIAHRLSTIKKSDKIIVIDKGKVIEEGNHKELIKRNGSYSEMVKSQNLDIIY